MTTPTPPDSRPLDLNKQFPVLFNYLIVSVMMVCVAVPMIDLLKAFAPTWNGNYLLLIAFIVALEGLYSARSTRHIPFPSRTWFAYRGTELVVILIVLKLLVYVTGGTGLGQLFQDLQLWQQDFLFYFFSGEYLAACLIILAVWVLSHQFNTKLLELEADEETLERERRYEFRNDRSAIQHNLMLTIVLIGAVLTVLTVVTRAYLRARAEGSAATGGSVFNLLLYIFLGLLLLSQTRLSALRATWYRERATISRELAGRWVAYGLVFLIAMAVLASVLPTRYSVGLLDTLRYALSLAMLAVQFLLYAIIFLLSIPLNWLLSLFGQPAAVTPTPPSMPEAPPAAAPTTPTSDPLLDLLSSIVFWAILLIVVGYSLVHFLNRHQALLMLLRRVPIIGWLVQIVQAVWGMLRQWNRQLSGAIDAGLRRLRTQQVTGNVAEQARFVSLRRMSPRERVQFFYLAMLRRGSLRGLARHPSQTPREYAEALERAVPEVDDEIDSLTETFVEARYSRHDVTPEAAGRVHAYWERIKSALRSRLF